MDNTEPLLPGRGGRAASVPIAAPLRRRSVDQGGVPLASSIVGSPFPYLLPRVPAPLVPPPTTTDDAAAPPPDVERPAGTPRASPPATPPFTTDGDAFFPVDRPPAAPAPAADAASAFALGVTYGLVQSIVALPTLVSFAFVAYPAATYAPFMGSIVKIAFLASALHQAVFVWKSSLPFAVGQVQDIGLIVLSSMTTDIARRGRHEHASREAILATALITLAAATAFVGITLIVLARAHAAAAIQNVPLPVVGGYLAYVGLFCILAGLSLSSGGLELSTLAGWRELVTDPSSAAPPLAACVAASAFLFIVIKRARHPAALPVAIITIPCVFFAALKASGLSLNDARAAGWVAPREPPAPFWSVYEHFHPPRGESILWSAAVAQIPRAIALAAVVVFGSCLDVCALLSDIPTLDIDTELETIGVSNALTGAAGAGLAGSYIFSACLFSFRAGVSNRIHGILISATLAAAFFLPFSPVPYLPSFFFGSLIVLFGVDILLEWLVHARHKVGEGEYSQLVLTFLAITALGLGPGVGFGLVISAAAFAFRFARTTVTAFSVVPSRAGAARPRAERDALAALSDRWACVSVDGYVFFGSALAISKRVGAVADALAAARAAADAPSVPRQLAAARAAAPAFLLLDFGRCKGVDATAASSFAALARRCAAAGVTLVVCGLKSKRAARLLAGHGFSLAPAAAASPPPPPDPGSGSLTAYTSVDDAVYAAEEAFLSVLRKAGALPAPAVPGAASSQADVAAALAAAAGGDAAAVAAATVAARRVVVRVLGPGDALYGPGDGADELWVVVAGTIEVVADLTCAAAPTLALPRDLAPPPAPRTFRFGPGSVVGAPEFFSGAPRRGTARAAPPAGATVGVLRRAALGELESREPKAAVQLLTALLAAEVAAGQHALEVLERSAA